MSRLIVFDFDGTIIDSFAVYQQAALDYSRQRGLPDPCLETLAIGYGHPEEHDFGWGVSKEEQLDHLMGTFRLADEYSLSGNPAHMPELFDGAKETLLALENDGFKLAIVTAKPEKPLKFMLDYHGIDHVFMTHRSYDDVERRREKSKPYPDQLLSVMAELGYTAQDTLMVGDTTMDIQMAHNAGVRSVGVTWGNHCINRLTEARAHHVLENHFSELTGVLENILSHGKPVSAIA